MSPSSHALPFAPSLADLTCHLRLQLGPEELLSGVQGQICPQRSRKQRTERGQEASLVFVFVCSDFKSENTPHILSYLKVFLAQLK